jgi:hypothetical protein
VFLWCLIDGYFVPLKTEWYSTEKWQYTGHIRLMYGSDTGHVRDILLFFTNLFYTNLLCLAAFFALCIQIGFYHSDKRSFW